MSFGFLTESALLPAKSKPIQVDGRSLVDLKAVVYAKEQKVKLEGGASAGGGLRSLRGKRAGSGDTGGSERKDPFARSNRGVEDRSQRDEAEHVTAAQKRKAAERALSAKASLYEKMAKGEVGISPAGSLVDFSRKTGADLAMLQAKAGKQKKRRRTNGVKGEDFDAKRASDDEYDDDNDGDSAEVNIIDDFGRDRTVARGSPEHLAYLEAKRAAAERKAQEETEAEAYDERYSFRGNKGTAPTARAPGGAEPEPSGSASWAWSSGLGRGTDNGDFETREGQERQAEKRMAKLLEREGGATASKIEGGSKILSQWEKTLTGDEKRYLKEVQEEAEAGRKRVSTDRNKQRSERKELLRRKQEARAARAKGIEAPRES